MSNRMTSTLVYDALQMALWRKSQAKSVIVYSDRGSQYHAHAYRDLMKKSGLIQSTSRKDNCWDIDNIFTHADNDDLTRTGIDLVSLC
ncbi:hypothetical protein N482_05885 [Pseudoalteromonas luteoviolacea NCIMB 1942]|uniref:Integrase catalytic domain-containing protein n=1 Tax=Pseudoalteromonas luteoviolacea NCIMB 1942 TaxID=1365253 RepID=A0A167FIU4_9GAMM|nr:hypothetical protein N482_05885 [Pseudoalteromonas luteoviolacea NCIMB 1942]